MNEVFIDASYWVTLIFALDVNNPLSESVAGNSISKLRYFDH